MVLGAGRKSQIMAAFAVLFPRIEKSSGFQVSNVPMRYATLNTKHLVQVVIWQRSSTTQMHGAEDEEVPPPTWSELQSIVSTNQLDALKRSKKHQNLYELHRIKVLKEYRTMYDYILYEKFGLVPTVADDGLLHVPRPSSTQPLKVLAENSFSYHVGENVCHWILWKLGEDCTEDDVADAEMELRSRLQDVRDFLHWKNPPHLQSLPHINHRHILVLKGGQIE
ncbi:hypothetical protein MPSEU_000539300 [Mayamaea pseudoterrestris]|nr:hypothetical protein MPSEU_000539300 [Mayamaea pseudoterrestris]